MVESMCSGCGTVAESHPFVGVARDQETHRMAAYPICYECWQNPAHRKRPLKMHFFERSQAIAAVTAAEENILVEKKPNG